jgi:hypothetical protein
MANKIMPWHQVVKLRADIRNEELSQKQFAADLYDVMMGKHPSVYHDPKEFFALTYPTTKLRDLARDVMRRLAGKSEKAVRQLHMTFGGGKTHSLITLVHLCQNPDALPEIPAVQQFKAHCEIALPKARIAAVVFDRLDAERGMEVRDPTGNIARFKMPWSVLAWQLGGAAAMKLMKDSGEERPDSPSTNVLEEVLQLARQDVPSILILFDEVLMFVRTMVDRDPAWEGRMTDFLHHLTQAVSKVPQCCLVASLLASDTKRMDELGRKISKELYDEFKRVADEGIQPVEQHDVPEILRRRLFELESYTDNTQWPAQVYATLNGIKAVDSQTAKNPSTEEKRFMDSYPFHPDLVNVLYGKWTGLEGFQQTRGILKTLASALRDAEKWQDTAPIIGAQVFLAAADEDGLSVATRELATIAQLEQYEGRKQNWTVILEAELKFARWAQEDLGGLKHREIEQAVIATFLHSQPIGQRAATRELLMLLGGGAPDKIELEKGLVHWADRSWYLDDTFTNEREAGLPKVWRLGSRPNLKQMHHDARLHISQTVLDEVLENQIGKATKLWEGAGGYGIKLHKLPNKPSEIEDDGEFHYAILKPKAASEAGKPSAEAKRFLDETAGPDKPRANNRNALVLAVPSLEAMDIAREKVRDFLGWEKVREMLKDRNDIDTARTAMLEASLRVASNEMVSQIVMAYCIVVTVDKKNEAAAYRITVDNTPLFLKIAADTRVRIESTAVNAEALLPGGPYDLWEEGEKSRFVKDLVGSFATTAKLPKMLNRTAILETLLSGCGAGDFVLRVTRSDKSMRTFWKCRPDDQALAESSLEVLLSDAATLVDLDPALLAPGMLPGLWSGDSIDLARLETYFSGTHVEPVDKGGYSENLLIPAATPEAIKAAVAGAVKSRCLWLVNGTISVLGEELPAGFFNEQAVLLAPPGLVPVTDLLPAPLASAWTDGETTGFLIHAALSALKGAGKPLPWVIVKRALDEGFQLGLLERTLDSSPWPCDLGGANSLKIRVPKELPGIKIINPPTYGTKIAAAELETHQIQDFSERIDELRTLTAGQKLLIRVSIEIGEGGSVPEDVVDKVNTLLEEIRPGWKAQ